MIKSFRKTAKKVALTVTALAFVLQTPLSALAAQPMKTDTTKYESQIVQQTEDTQEAWTEEEIMSACGYIQSEEDKNVKPSIDDGIVRGTFQEYYRNTQVPAIRNQNPYGTCWAFSTVACMEINLMKQGINMDLSELQLVHNTYNNKVVDPLGGTVGDSYQFSDNQNSILNRGGNYKYASDALSKGLGIVTEAAVPYSNAQTVSENGLDSSYAFENNVVYMKSAIQFDGSNLDLVKENILKCGAVGISYGHFNNYLNGSAYYCPEDTTPNHAVTIVGWDDNYSKDNFLTAPEGDGAWIVRNSWGTWFGENGYFYISYYDMSLDDSMYVFEATLSSEYDNRYQYDGGFFAFPSVYAASIKNIFEAKGNGENPESITAVMFNNEAEDIQGTVNIITGLSSINDYTGGTVVSSKTVSLNKTGWITVELETPVTVQAGQFFAIELVANSGQMTASREYPSLGAASGTVSASTYNSYYKYIDNWGYTPTTEYNICFKALTVNLDESYIEDEYDEDGPFDISKIEACKGDETADYSWIEYENGLVIFTGTNSDITYKPSELVKNDIVALDKAKYIYWNAPAPANCEGLFTGLGNTVLQEVRFGNRFVKTSADITSMKNMFADCASLKVLDLSKLDLSGLTNTDTWNLFSDNIHMIKTPVGLANEVSISKVGAANKSVVWKEYNSDIDASGEEYTVLPMNKDTSITLVRTDNHSYEKVESDSYAATCEKNGLTVEKCKDCGGIHKTVIKASGHKPGKEVVENRVEPTYKANGSYDVVVYCTVCNKELSRVNKIIPKLTSGWKKNDDGTKYYINEEGEILKGWQEIEGNWYYMNSEGIVQTDWQKVSNKWYYMDAEGVMQTGWIELSDKWYYLDGSGAMKTNWQKIGGKWYYFRGDGVMQTGWIKLSNKWYYLDGSGAMKTGWQEVSNKWYYFNGDGVMQTGWIKLSNKWYYLDGSGAMKTNWQRIGGKWYYFNGSGAMQTGWIKLSDEWYYLKGDGAMVTGSYKIGNKTYYFDNNGVWIG